MSVFKKEMSPRQRQRAQKRQSKRYFKDKGKKSCFGCILPVLICIGIIAYLLVS